jgi:hypothetical protein
MIDGRAVDQGARICVVADDADYRVAAAELPASVRLVDEADGAIVVIAGDAPVRAGSAPVAVLLADPPMTGRSGREALPPGIPVIVDRARLRPDVAVDVGARSDAVLFTAECTAATARVDEAVRDAVGWLRVISAGEIGVDAVHATGTGAIALLRAAGCTATVSVTVLADPSAKTRLRVLAVGPERVEVTVDGIGEASVALSSEAGRLTFPTRRESRRRVALRRAVEAASSRFASDLDDLEHDERVAREILHAYKQPLSPT